MDRFYASWQDGKRAKARKLHKLTAFIEFCVKRKWLKEDISADLEPPEGHSIEGSDIRNTHAGIKHDVDEIFYVLAAGLTIARLWLSLPLEFIAGCENAIDFIVCEGSFVRGKDLRVE
jgi:hypothetical protein